MDGLTSTAFVGPIGIAALWLTFFGQLDQSYDLYLAKYEGNLPRIVIACTTVYFIIDSYKLIKECNHRKNIGYYMHHIVGILSLLLYYLTGSPQKIIINYLVYELSTPFLNLMLYHRKNNTLNTIYGIFFQIIFILTFFTVRVIYGTFLSYEAIQISKNNYPQLMILPIGLQTLNYFWFWKIMHLGFRSLILKNL